MSIENEVLHEYLQISRSISDNFRSYYGKLKLTYPQSVVLAILESDGPMPISELATAAGSANSTVSGVVDRLEKMELVERLRSDSDHRVIYVAVTQKFRDHMAEISATADSQFGIVLSELSAEDGKTVLKGLKLLNQALTHICEKSAD